MNEQRNSNVECGLTKGATTSSTSSKRSNLSSILDQGEARSNSVDEGLLITNQSN
jgi:hypothetical protein